MAMETNELFIVYGTWIKLSQIKSRKMNKWEVHIRMEYMIENLIRDDTIQLAYLNFGVRISNQFKSEQKINFEIFFRGVLIAHFISTRLQICLKIFINFSVLQQ